MTSAQRVVFIDIAKGISILCVVFGHSHLATLLPVADHMLGLIRMPLFFFLAGIFFTLKMSSAAFIRNKSDALLKPYLVTLLLLIPLELVLNRIDSAPEALFGIFYGTGTTISLTPLWFLSHLWLIFLASYVVTRSVSLLQRDLVWQLFFIGVLYVVGSSIMGWFWLRIIEVAGESYTLQGLPFSLDILPFSMTFFLAGACLKSYLKSFSPSWLLCVIAVALLGYIQIMTEARLGLVHRILQEPFWVLLASVSGIYAILVVAYLASYTKLLSTMLAFCGANSLFILIFHAPVENNFYKLVAKFMGDQYALILSLLSFTFCVVVSLLFAILIRKYKVFSVFFLPVRSGKSVARQPN